MNDDTSLHQPESPHVANARRPTQEAALAQFIQASLEVDDVLDAVLGSTVGNLWETLMPLDREIRATLGEDGLAAFTEVAPALDMSLKLHRQAERYLQLLTRRAGSH
jgi:hypothetical protein